LNRFESTEIPGKFVAGRLDSALTTGTDSIPYNPTVAEDKRNLELAPDDATAYRNRGLSYSDLGQYRRA